MLSKDKYSIARVGVTAALMMLIIMLPSMLQNHGIYIIRGDYVDQYITRLIRAKEILSTGVGSWDWYNFLGAPYNRVDGLFSLNSVCLLFPVEIIPYAVTYMHLIRVAIIAITAYSYLRYMVNQPKTAFIGAVLYTFSSFTFISFEFMQFLESMWTFPLILLSAEKMFREEKYKHQLIVTVFLASAVSFYNFVFSTISFAIYFLCRFFFSEEWAHKRKIKYFLMAVFEYLLGIMCSFFIFAPFIYKMFNSAGSTEDIGRASITFSRLIADGSIVAKVFSFFLPAASNRFSSFGVSNWMTRATYIPVFGVAFALALFFKKGRNKWLKILTVASVICIINPAISLVYNAFSSTYTRYAYAMILFMILATVTFMEDYDEKIAKKSTYATIACFSILIIGFYGASFIFSNHSSIMYVLQGPESGTALGTQYRFFALAAAIPMYACLIGYVHSKGLQKRILPVLAVVITIYGCAYSVMNLESDDLLDYYAESSIDLETQVEKYYVNRPNVDDGRDYRIDASKHCRNYAYVMRKPSISIFESVRSNYSHEMTKYLNMYSGDVSSYPTGTENETRTLFGVKYYYDLYPEDKAPVPEGFSYIKTDNGVGVYQNDNFMGMGFSYDSYITRSDFDKIAETSDYLGDIMLNALVVEDKDEAFVSGILEPYREGYICENRIVPEEFATDSGGFSTTFRSDKPEVVYISLPYEKIGWEAEINGKDAEFIRANVGCVAVKIQPGESVITFRYTSPAKKFGLTVSLFGWIILVGYLIISRKKKA